MVESEIPKSGWIYRTHLIFICGLLSVLPLMFLQTINLWTRPHFRFYAVAWILFAIVIIKEPKIGFAASPLRRRFGIGLTLTGFAFSFLSAVFISPGLAQLALMVLVTGWILVWLGIVPWTRLLALTGLLWITWPWPRNLDTQLITWLHDRACKTVSPLLDLISTPNLLMTSYLDLRGDRIEFSNIVGGLDSVFLLAFSAIVLLLMFRRPLILSVLTLLLVPVLSWLQSALHILILTWAQESLGANLTVGGSSFGLSVGLFVLSVVFLLLVIDGMSFLMEPLPVELAQQAVVGFHGLYNRIVLWPGLLTMDGGDSEDDDYFDEVDSRRRTKSVQRQGPPVRLTMNATDPWGDIKLSIWFALAFLPVGVLGAIGYFVTQFADQPVMPSYSEAQLAAIASADTLPAEIHGLKRVGAQLLKPETVHQANSHTIVWRYNAIEGSPLVSLDFPHLGLQEHWMMAVASGWKFKSKPKQLMVSGEGGGAGWPIVEVELENELGTSAYALYSAFDITGIPAVPEEGWGSSYSRRLSSTVFGRLMNNPTEIPITFQTQLLLEFSTPLSDSRKSEYRAAMVEATAAMKHRVMGEIVK